MTRRLRVTDDKELRQVRISRCCQPDGVLQLFDATATDRVFSSPSVQSLSVVADSHKAHRLLNYGEAFPRMFPRSDLDLAAGPKDV